MYINRKSSLYASPRNELHVGNESGESRWFTILTGIVIVAVLIALLLAFITFSKSSAMGLNQPMQAGTGECGYFRNVTLFHRNGLVNPHYCYDDTAEFSIDPFILHNASVQTDMPVVTVERIDNTGTDETSTNDTVSTFEPASDVVVSNEPIVETVAEVVNNEPVQNDTPALAELGNPGNDKNVGHSGEHCDQGMCENGDSGSRGNSQP